MWVLLCKPELSFLGRRGSGVQIAPPRPMFLIVCRTTCRCRSRYVRKDLRKAPADPNSRGAPDLAHLLVLVPACGIAGLRRSYRCFMAKGKEMIPRLDHAVLPVKSARLDTRVRADFVKSLTAGFDPFECFGRSVRPKSPSTVQVLEVNGATAVAGSAEGLRVRGWLNIDIAGTRYAISSSTWCGSQVPLQHTAGRGGRACPRSDSADLLGRRGDFCSRVGIA